MEFDRFGRGRIAVPVARPGVVAAAGARNQRMKRIWLILTLAVAAAAAAQHVETAEDRGEEPPKSQPTFIENISRMLQAVQTLGPWEQNYEQMMSAVETVFERNGWTSESDQFSLELIRAVEAIPPFQFQERFDTLIGMLSDRYLLDEEQEMLLRRTMIRESTSMMQKHSGRIMQYAMEAIQTRAAGEPFTAEQVARWADLAGPVFEDGRKRVNIVAREFMQNLDEQQLKIAAADLDAANHRMSRIAELREKWAAGKWSAADWGLEHDPIQSAGEAQRAAETTAKATEAGGEESATGGAAGAPAVQKDAAEANGRDTAAKSEKKTTTRSEPSDPWARYVAAFIRKYQLDAGQQDRAWSIHDSVKPRVDQLERRYQQRLAAMRGHSTVPAEDRAKAEIEITTRHEAELERLFYQMNRRLERLPSTAQKRNADKSDLPLPIRAVVRTSPRSTNVKTEDGEK